MMSVSASPALSLTSLSLPSSGRPRTGGSHGSSRREGTDGECSPLRIQRRITAPVDLIVSRGPRPLGVVTLLQLE